MTPAEDLRREIEQCHRSRLAYDREEHTEGISAVGTAFLDPLGRALAVSIPVPTARFARQADRLIAELRRGHREIESLLSA
jgi:DNA-binding IclR family transcriptional regulator